MHHYKLKTYLTQMTSDKNHTIFVNDTHYYGRHTDNSNLANMVNSEVLKFFFEAFEKDGISIMFQKKNASHFQRFIKSWDIFLSDPTVFIMFFSFYSFFLYVLNYQNILQFERIHYIHIH